MMRMRLLWKLRGKISLCVMILFCLTVYVGRVVSYASKINFTPQNIEVNEIVCFSWGGEGLVSSWLFWNQEGYRVTSKEFSPCVSFPEPGNYFVTVSYSMLLEDKKRSVVTEIHVAPSFSKTSIDDK